MAHKGTGGLVRAGGCISVASVESRRMAAITASTNLLIAQWANSPHLSALLQVWIDVLREEVGEPLERLQEMLNLDTARGVWLDYLGERLGLPRPWDTRATNDRFGFDVAGLGFDQGRFSNEPELEARAPIADTLYRNLIRARAVLLLGAGDAPTFERAIAFIDPEAVVSDLHDMTFRVVTGRRRIIELAERAQALPRPAGVQMILADRERFGFDLAGVSFDQGGFV